MIKHLLSILFATTRQQFKYIIIIWFLDSINVCTFGWYETLTYNIILVYYDCNLVPLFTLFANPTL